MERTEILETTLGDLIVALTEEASKLVSDEKDACRLAAFALSHLLHNSGVTARSWQYWQ